MLTKIQKKGHIIISPKIYDDSGSLVIVYSFSNAKLFKMIDIWVMKDNDGQPTALRGGASFKESIDDENYKKALQNFSEENHLCFGELVTGYLSFDTLGSVSAQQKVKKFLDKVCSAEKLPVGSFDFMLDLPLLNNVIKKPSAISKYTEDVKPAHTTLFSPLKGIDRFNKDGRFKVSTQPGVLFEACSYSYVSDEELKAYGAKKWKRDKDGVDNFVYVVEMEKRDNVDKCNAPKLRK